MEWLGCWGMCLESYRLGIFSVFVIKSIVLGEVGFGLLFSKGLVYFFLYLWFVEGVSSIFDRVLGK